MDSFAISNKDDLISRNLSFEISKFYDIPGFQNIGIRKTEWVAKNQFL